MVSPAIKRRVLSMGQVSEKLQYLLRIPVRSILPGMCVRTMYPVVIDLRTK